MLSLTSPAIVADGGRKMTRSEARRRVSRRAKRRCAQRLEDAPLLKRCWARWRIHRIIQRRTAAAMKRFHKNRNESPYTLRLGSSSF